jgi:hypothetical protein
MNTFIETIAIAGGLGLVLVFVIVVLTLFYRTLRWISGADTKPDAIFLRGVLKSDTLATVHVSGREAFERVRLTGLLRSNSGKNHFPFEFNNMVILEDEQKQRYLIRSKDIRMIVVPPVGNS